MSDRVTWREVLTGRAIVGFLLAPAACPAFVAIFAAVRDAIGHAGGWPGPTLLETVTVVALLTVLVCYPVGWTIGLPVHWLMMRSGQTAMWHYVVAGTMLGLAVSVPLAIFLSSLSLDSDPDIRTTVAEYLKIWGPMLTGSGAFTGLLFWLVTFARPGTPTEKTPHA